MFDNLSDEQILEAIRKGVHDAMWQMITNATQMPCADFFDTLKQGIHDGIEDAMPLRSDIKEAIAEGVAKSMPWPSEIADAVYQANKNQE